MLDILHQNFQDTNIVSDSYVVNKGKINFRLKYNKNIQVTED